MSKKTKNTKEKEQILTVQPKGDIFEAQSLTIMPIMKDFQLSQLNNTIVLQYFKEMALNQIVENNQTLSFQLYGKKQHFKIIDIQFMENLQEEQKQNEQDEEDEEQEQVKKEKALVTKRTNLKMMQYQSTVQKTENQSENVEKNEQEKNKELIVLAGLDHIQQQLISNIKLALFKQEKFEQLGFPALKGIMISGPSGTGKTKLVKKIAQILENDKVQSYLIESKSLLSRVVGEAEKKIEQIFHQAKSTAPSLIFFDDLHVIASKKDSNSSTLVSTLAAEIDKINTHSKVIVLAATNNEGKLSEEIKRAGRFDKDIKLDIPKAQDRKQIFEAYLQKVEHQLSQTEIQDVNYQMNGFTGADIVSLMREAVLNSVGGENQDGGENKLEKQHFESALQEIQPSGIKEILMDIPKVYWSDIGGYQHVKDEIKKVTEWPLKYPEAFTRMGISPSKGVLLYGPPGCSKTMIAKAIATESKLNFLAVKGPELFSKYVGDSEKAVREVFRRARLCSPSVIFFDEIDAIATQRSVNTDVSERVLISMLNEMDGIEGLKGVVIIAATNRPDIIDKALTRPGRFDHLIYVPPPNLENRLDILKINVFGNKMPVDEGIDLEQIARQTENYSGAEMSLICREAGLIALSKNIHCEKVTMDDFQAAMKKVKPRINQVMLQSYIQFESNQKLF